MDANQLSPWREASGWHSTGSMSTTTGAPVSHHLTLSFRIQTFVSNEPVVITTSRTMANSADTASISQSRLPPAASGLYRLPQELRDQVFHELWKLAPVVLLNQKNADTSVPIILSYGSRTTTSIYSQNVYGLPKWLLASKAILNDGLRQLLRNAAWEWYEPRVPAIGYSNPLVGMSAATNFAVLDHAFLHNRRARTDAALQPLEKPYHSAELITPLLSSKLQVLDLNLRIQMHHRDTCILHLSRFGSKNLRLNKLKICLRLKLAALSASTHEHDVAYASFLAQAESEVTALARAWVGETSTIQLEETISWFSDIHTRHEQAYVRGLPAKDSRRHHITFTVVRNAE